MWKTVILLSLAAFVFADDLTEHESNGINLLKGCSNERK